MLSSLVRNKFVAIYLGPSGTGIIGTVLATLEFFKRLITFGSEVYIVKEIAQIKDDREKQRIKFFQSLISAFFIGLICLIIVLIMLSINAIKDEKLYITQYILILLPFLSISLLYQSYLQGRSELKKLSSFIIATSIITMLVPLFIFWLGPAKHEIDSLIMLHYSTPLIIVVIYIKYKPILSFLKRAPRINWKETFNFSERLNLFIPSLINSGSVFLINYLIIEFLGEKTSGYYYSAYALGSVSLGLILQATSKEFYPRISALSDRESEYISTLNMQINLVLSISFVCVILGLVCGKIIIPVLFSKDYLPAYAVFVPLLMMFYVRGIIWTIGFALLGKNETKVFRDLEILSTFFVLGVLALALVFAETQFIWHSFFLSATLSLVFYIWKAQEILCFRINWRLVYHILSFIFFILLQRIDMEEIVKTLIYVIFIVIEIFYLWRNRFFQ